MSNYLLTGWIFYGVMAILRRDTFKNADNASVFRGLVFGVLLWPVAMIYVAYDFLRK